jgi:hypothetical protein
MLALRCPAASATRPARQACAKWDLTLGNRWARVAKCLQLLSIPVEMAGDANKEVTARY